MACLEGATADAGDRRHGVACPRVTLFRVGLHWSRRNGRLTDYGGEPQTPDRRLHSAWLGEWAAIDAELGLDVRPADHAAGDGQEEACRSSEEE